MTEALNYLYVIFDEMTEFVFNDMVIFTGVTFGWVVVSVVLCPQHEFRCCQGRLCFDRCI